MEVTKDLQKNCTGAIITINQANADYIVMMNRESKQNRGLLRNNSQIQVANKAGDVIGTNATHTVGNAAKDACNLIVSDWQAHGPMSVPQTSEAPAPQPASVQPAVQTSRSAQVVPAVATSAPSPSDVAPTSSNSLADAAKREKQRKACLDLAKDNPSITCQ
jgi:predicted component of type VI protein secretion system